MTKLYLDVDGQTYEEKEVENARILDNGWVKTFKSDTSGTVYSEVYYPPTEVWKIEGKVYEGDA